jgi:microcystin-dependent protein
MGHAMPGSPAAAADHSAHAGTLASAKTGRERAAPGSVVATHDADTHGVGNVAVAQVQRDRTAEPGTGLADVDHRVLVYADLRSRTPIGYASSVDPSWQPPSVQIGESAGVENVTLLSSNLPAHTHSLNTSTADGTHRAPMGRVFATGTSTATQGAAPVYGPSNGTLAPMSPQSIAASGGSQPHPNLQPYGVINFCLALSGIYPSRN